uniref:F-box domain-containing protein n=1 Tax=Timema bartmani TaxID=61472 RepID=A0A7R9HYY1_9NEOP|nr:unnamed protein product [Timema bartmani]
MYLFQSFLQLVLQRYKFTGMFLNSRVTFRLYRESHVVYIPHPLLQLSVPFCQHDGLRHGFMLLLQCFKINEPGFPNSSTPKLLSTPVMHNIMIFNIPFYLESSELGWLTIEEANPHLRGRKNHPSSSERDSNLDIPVLGSLAQHTSSALANYATEAENTTIEYWANPFNDSGGEGGDSVVMSSSEIESEDEVLKLHLLGSDSNCPGSSKQSDNACEKSKVKRSRPHKESDCEAGGDQLSDEHSMLGEYITREYELLRLVLSYLNRKDLLAATKVCKTWQSVANIVLRGRTKLGSMFWMTSKDHSHWKKYFTRLFENKLFSDPKNCLLFLPPILHSSRKEMASFVSEKMGPSCSMLTLKVEGVIGTDAEDKVFEVEDFIAFSGLLLPAMPGVTVRQFHLCKKKVVRLAKGVSIDMVLCSILGLATGK